MKRLAQFVAILAMAFLVIPPALAGVICTPAESAACVPSCPMAMDSMGADCPMVGQAMASECPLNCCAQNALHAVAPLVPSEKVRLAISLLAAVLPGAPLTIGAQASLFAPLENKAVSPPIYILNQVFRI